MIQLRFLTYVHDVSTFHWEKARVLLNTKESMSKLSVSEDTTKVAHGDANLALDDFLKAFE